MEELNLINEFKKIGWGLLYVIGFIVVISVFNLTFWYIFGLICISRIISEIKGGQFNIKRLAINCLITLCLMMFLYWLSAYGLIGYIIGIAVICGYILYSRRAAYMRAIHYTEFKIYGKPLKEYKEDKRVQRKHRNI